jgi:DNA processing protein
VQRTPRSREEAQAALALSLLPGVGAVTFAERVARFGSAARALGAAPERERVVAQQRATEALDRCEAIDAQLIPQSSESYPSSLLELPDPPLVLFARGALSCLTAPIVAIVGTREASPYGERVTKDLARALASAGACVVSGMARGIDSAAHRAALAAGGRSIAVLGTGIDVVYPAANRALYHDLVEQGLVLSEEMPGLRATRGSFPKRNRIIAALASVTIVVEAGFKSGALITASHALDLGRTVAAVPGQMDEPRSAGANQLLRDGAVVIAAVDDALALIGAPPQREIAPQFASEHEQLVWQALGEGLSSIDMLATRLSLPPRELLATITTLEIAGLVECSIAGDLRRRRA